MEYRRTAHALAAVTLAWTLTGAGAAIATAGPTSFTKQTFHFVVHVGPDDNVTCDVMGDLYTPASASSDSPVPAILTTNGFAGSKDAQEPIATMLAGRGYAVLAYSGLGFGESNCKVTLDDPDYDGKAASQLVSFLGGQEGNAYTDAEHLQPVPSVDFIVSDALDHDGQARTHDPRVGMVGSSYGGQVQFAAASVDPRIDTIIPMNTWNNLNYSLTPNNADLLSGVTSGSPGAMKTFWSLGLGTIGALSPSIQGYREVPDRALPCPNFPEQVCSLGIDAAMAGFPTPTGAAFLSHASVSSYIDRIKIPVLLVQGQQDTLFNLNEARSTYDALQNQGTEVKMIWQHAGHSDLEPAPGESHRTNLDPETQYIPGRIVDWLDHHLRGTSASPGPAFAYYRNWVTYEGNAAPAYAEAAQVDVGRPHELILAGNAALVERGEPITLGAQSLTTTAAGLPTGISNVDIMPMSSLPSIPEQDIPGTTATWTSAPSPRDLDIVGAPRLTARFTTERPLAGTPEDAVVLFAKLYDVAPDGTTTLINGQVAPARITDTSNPTTISMPAIVHRLAPGHSLRLSLAGGDMNFRGGLVPHHVTIAAGTEQVLSLPVVGA